MEISYIDRKSGAVCVEKVYGQKALSLLYGEGFFKRLFSFFFLPVLVKVPFFSRAYGYIQKTEISAKKVNPFIAAYGIDASEFIEKEFRSFNDFFIRKLKPERRPVIANKERVATPADGRYLVYPTFDQFVVKGQEFSLKEFLGDAELAKRYAQGSMTIIRLCPTDYHRFHFPCDGRASETRLINGPLYSVNPIALKKRIQILSENKRMITEIATEHFGPVLYVEIGATSVGSIHQTFLANSTVRKGEEKGYFEFGGSCIVLLFERERVVFDEDLVANTMKGLETRCNFGVSLASKHSSANRTHKSA